MKHIAQRAIIEDHDLAEVGLDGAEVLDERAVSEGAVLSVVPRREELALRLQPVDHGIRVLLHRRREHHQVEPLADLREKSIISQS